MINIFLSFFGSIFLCFNNLFDECSHIQLQNFFKERHNIVKDI